MIRPCPSPPTNCNPCADGNPYANLSAEDPDRNLWLQVNFRRLPNPPPNNWSTTICAAYCESEISQADADDCARRMTFDCIVDRPPPNPGRTSWPTPTFCNQEMTCQNGEDCYTIPSGSICDFSQTEANALAQSYCEDRVFDPSLTSACPVVFPPAPVEEEMVCEQETGTATPASLEISLMQSWETAAVSKEALQTLISSDLMCTTGVTYFDPPVRDHPPGIYGLTWVSGYYRYTGPSDCQDDPSFPYSAQVHVYRLVDEEFNYDNPIPCNNQGLANTFSLLPPGSGGADGSGPGGCFANEAAALAYFAASLTPRAFMANPYPPDEAGFNFSHSNTQGDFRLYFSDGAIDIFNPFLVFVGTMDFRVVQFEGLIPQPRKVAIENYGSLNFADDAAAADWDGTFPERTVYNNMSAQWAVTAAGAFGGAILKYVSTHPTSANGRGWQMDAFSAGGILMYRAFKAVGSTPLGIYYKHAPSTPSGPPCVTCVDDSDTVWYPGENPP